MHKGRENKQIFNMGKETSFFTNGSSQNHQLFHLLKIFHPRLGLK